MAGVLDATNTWIDSLGDLDPFHQVLAETARELAANVDDPPRTANGGVASIAPYAGQLRATLALMRKELAGAESDDDGGWGQVVPIGA